MVMTSGEDYQRLELGQPIHDAWAFYIYKDERKTWLIASSYYENSFFRYLFYEIPLFIMERKMLSTIAELAES